MQRADAHATFFLCGEQVERNPALAAEIVAAGHTPAVHGYRHRNMLRLAPRTFVDDLERGIAAIEDASGIRPDLYRPPYGIFSYPGMVEVQRPGPAPAALVALGTRLAGGQVAGEIAAEVTEDLRGGDVLLLHDADHYSEPGCWRGTVAALPAVLERIERGRASSGRLAA